jgi:c-di-GMP-binding flagellar brake protein YcgR
MEKNRRIAKRIPFLSGVRYQIKGSQQFGNIRSKDVSKSGIAFVSNEFLPVATHLIFEFKLPEKKEYVKVLGKVVWVSNQSCSEKYLIGVQFDHPINDI